MFNRSVFQGSETHMASPKNSSVICTTPALAWSDRQDYSENFTLAAQGGGEAECTGLLGELGKY